MKETRRDTELRLKRAIERETPDALPEILRRIDSREAGHPGEAPVTAGAASRPRARGAALPKWAAGLAAALVLLFGVYLAYGYFTPESVVGLDVNPSIELKVNRAEKVLSATPLGEDAVAILSGMDLRHVDLNVAVNAIIGSMVKNGYISELKNSILVSVDSRDAGTGSQLQARLTGEISDFLSGCALNGAVLSQTLTEDARLESLAAEHGISPGKAALVDLLVSQSATLSFSDVAALSINDINLLITAKQPELPGVESSGTASSGAYIGEERALASAVAHAGADEASLSSFEVELDYDDGRMVYEVEFLAGGAEYEYEIDALTGGILEFSREGAEQAPPPPSPAAPPSSSPPSSPPTSPSPTARPSGGGYVGETAAQSAALRHAGADSASVRELECKLEEEDGRMIYEVEFVLGETEYEYEIDALTGEVLRWDSDSD